MAIGFPTRVHELPKQMNMANQFHGILTCPQWSSSNDRIACTTKAQTLATSEHYGLDMNSTGGMLTPVGTEKHK